MSSTSKHQREIHGTHLYRDGNINDYRFWEQSLDKSEVSYGQKVAKELEHHRQLFVIISKQMEADNGDIQKILKARKILDYKTLLASRRRFFGGFFIAKTSRGKWNLPDEVMQYVSRPSDITPLIKKVKLAEPAIITPAPEKQLALPGDTDFMTTNCKKHNLKRIGMSEEDYSFWLEYGVDPLNNLEPQWPK